MFLTDAAACLLRLLPPERAHGLTLSLLRAGKTLIPRPLADPPALAVQALGLKFPNPLGLAAGFDKDAQAPDALLRLGFGFVEFGTVTPRPQAGNPRPRLFRLPEDRAVINRMGFNNRGMAAAARALAARKRRGIAGINIGANKDSADRIADYRAGFLMLAPLAEYVTVNVSSPNTPGLRALQDAEALRQLLDTLIEARGQRGLRVPLLLKIAPDLELPALDDIARIALDCELDGLIVSNTTLARPAFLRSRHAGESGGLSGAPLFAPSTALLKETRKRVSNRLVLVGVGGVSSGAEAYAKIRAGASLVQLYTALALQGPGLIARIKHDLLACLTRDGFSSVSEAVGMDIV